MKWAVFKPFLMLHEGSEVSLIKTLIIKKHANVTFYKQKVKPLIVHPKEIIHRFFVWFKAENPLPECRTLCVGLLIK